eukprot:Blabericola_migrator_1__2400@NODE_1674_length_4037_cov_10_159194_g1087_i0_p2_GENE_NODE_1674_length_4037_cov_10_159194_g1087_i0NODE_1674_length_4037_cov_10_159194_g1087_i0_p2_ORF_typecomplete_len101_score10_02RT_RNaseH_2/PF17919_1/0_23_NODE_1674_length_4037_cov_10_159194_g1087_i015691871
MTEAFGVRLHLEEDAVKHLQAMIQRLEIAVLLHPPESGTHSLPTTDAGNGALQPFCLLSVTKRNIPLNSLLVLTPRKRRWAAHERKRTAIPREASAKIKH